MGGEVNIPGIIRFSIQSCPALAYCPLRIERWITSRALMNKSELF